MVAQAYIYHVLFGNIRKLDKLTSDSVRNKHREPAASVLSPTRLSVNRTPYSTSHRSLASTKGRFHRSAEEAPLKRSSAHQATHAGNPRYFRPAATPRAYERLQNPYVYGWTRPLVHRYFQHYPLAGNADRVIYRQSWKLHCARSNPR